MEEEVRTTRENIRNLNVAPEYVAFDIWSLVHNDWHRVILTEADFAILTREMARVKRRARANRKP
jgi:SNF2 family DNA or RNA helicase